MQQRVLRGDTEAVVEVKCLLRIPDYSGLYETHDADALDPEAIQQAIQDELIAWWQPLGVEVSGAEVQVIAIRERK